MNQKEWLAPERKWLVASGQCLVNNDQTNAAVRPAVTSHYPLTTNHSRPAVTNHYPLATSHSRPAFTMAEMLVAVTIMVIVTAVVASLFVQIRKMVGLAQWSAETRAQLRTTVNTLADDLKNMNDQAYFIMLNRDYGWDPNQTGTNVLRTGPGNAAGAVIYPPNPSAPADNAPDRVVNRRIWSDRIAFVADGPFNTLQNLPHNGTPATATAARVYYGQSLWTHELADMVWTRRPVTTAGNEVLRVALNPFVTQAGNPGPYQMSTWPNRIDQRPAVGWSLLRQAVLWVNDPTADAALGNPSNWLGLNPNREIDWRMTADNEFQILNSTLGIYTLEELAVSMDSWRQLANNVKDSKNWFSLLLSPRIDSLPESLTDKTIRARARLLMPHAARVRFQVRLSDGTVVPQTDDSNDNPRLRGGLVLQATTGAVTGWSSDYSVGYTTTPSPRYVFVPQSPTAAPTPPALNPPPVHASATDFRQVPMKQMVYMWTKTGSNLSQLNPAPPNGIGPLLYPVALRVRIESYDPDKRTPDPIAVDEWLPMRWRNQVTP